MNELIKIRSLIYGLVLIINFSNCCDSKLAYLEKTWVIERLIVDGNEKALDSLIINLFSFSDDGICSLPVTINNLSIKNDGTWSVMEWQDKCIPKIRIVHGHDYYNGIFEVFLDQVNQEITLKSEKIMIEGRQAFNLPF